MGISVIVRDATIIPRGRLLFGGVIVVDENDIGSVDFDTVDNVLPRSRYLRQSAMLFC